MTTIDVSAAPPSEAVGPTAVPSYAARVVLRPSVLVAGFVLLACGSAVAPAHPAPETGVAWATRNAVAIHVKDDPRSLALMDEIAKKRVVYLGEPDHYVFEKYEMRLLFVERLFARGWRRLGMEMGRSDGAHVDAYLASGDERELDRIGIYAPGGVKTARSGILKGLPPGAKAEFVAAEKSFCRKLRVMSEARTPGTPRLRWFGFDVDTDPLSASEQMAGRLEAGDVRSILERAATTAPAALANELAAAASTVEGETRADILGLADSWRFAAVAFHDPSNAALMAAHAEREKTMFRQLEDALSDPGPIVLMGHDMHLAKASASVRFTSVGKPGAESWRTVGTHVAEKLRDDVFAIWMLADHGLHFDVACSTGACEFVSKTDTVEHVLAQVGTRFALPLRDAPPPFAGEVNWQQNGRYGSGVLTRQADLLYFVAETTPPHAW